MKDVDEFSNVRYDLLVRAKQENPPDIGRIVSFYTEFERLKQTQGEQSPQYTQQELMQQPHSANTGAIAPQQSMGIQWNTATASQFYKDKALGKISPEDAEALEKDLYRAMGGG